MNTEFNNLSRRVFLKTSAIGTAAILAGRAVSFSEQEKKENNKISIGVQLYSLRGLGNIGRSIGGRGMSRSGGSSMEVPVAFEGIKKLGYEGVEFAGFYGYDNKADEMKKLLDDNGLTACGFHLQ